MKVYVLKQEAYHACEEVLGVFSTPEAAKAFAPGDWKDQTDDRWDMISYRNVPDQYPIEGLAVYAFSLDPDKDPTP